MNLPIIRLEIEGMKLAILQAFSSYQAQNDVLVREAVTKFCEPENAKRIVEQCVDRELKSAIENEIADFFRYGEGKQFLAAAVKQKLSESN